MEDISEKKNIIRRNKKKKTTINESFKTKKIQFYQPSYKRSKSQNIKNARNKSLLEPAPIINLIVKGPSINKLFFKNDNISLKSESMPKTNKKVVKKFRSINVDKAKNDIFNNIIINNNLDNNSKNSNVTLNYYNMDCIEKIHNLRGEAKDFSYGENNQKQSTVKKKKKPNYISKNYISNDKLINFNNNLKRNPIYEFYQPFKEKELLKKPIHKIQSVNQEKRQYKYSDFKVNKDANENDDSLGNINPDDYREGNIEFIGGSSFSEEKDESSSLSSNRGNEIKKEKKKKKSDKLSNLVNKSMKNREKKKIERFPSQNYYNSNNNSEIEDNYFKNDTKFFMSPKINSEHPSNKSVKSDTKSDYFNSIILYFNDPNDSMNKNSFHGGAINKNRIKKIESLATNSNNDYEGDIEDEYDLPEAGDRAGGSMEQNKSVNNITINDSYFNLKNLDVSQNNINNTINNENIANSINHTIKSFSNAKQSVDNMNNNIINEYYYFDNNFIDKNINNNLNSNNLNSNNSKIDKNSQNKNTEFQLKTIMGNSNQSNIINIHNMNNFNNNNFIFGNENLIQMNPNINHPISNLINNNINIPKNDINNKQSSYILNKNNLYDFQTTNNNRMNETNLNINNYIANKNNQINSYQLNQLALNNRLINENNNQYINYDLSTNINRYIINNSNYFHPNINTNLKNNLINNNINNFYNKNQLYNLTRFENQNNINLDYIKYLNISNNTNNELNNINNLNSVNNQNQFIKQRKGQKNFNNYLNQRLVNPTMINVNNQNINNQNYMNPIYYNSYINPNTNIVLNNGCNINNMNLYNNINSINNPNQNANLNSKINIANCPNNLNFNDNYKMLGFTGSLNHQLLNNNNININSKRKNNYSSTKQRKQNLNLLSNEELSVQAYSLAKYQNGCRYLQKRIENNQKLVPTLFFPNILGHIQELSNDQFGNYYIKIIIKYLPEDMIYKLIQLIHPSIPKIGTNQYGTKVLQYLIDFLKNEKNLLFFIEKTLPHVVILINDLNGIHIIQRLICVKSNYIQLIYNKIFMNIQFIAITRDGSNFIKKLLDFLDENNMILLLNSINDNLDAIITNQYGNYIIQNILMKDNLVLKFQIIETIIKNIVCFSNQKFSSNVVEKCFEVKEMKDKVIDEIIKNNNFEQILLNEYGNYVIQKALAKSDLNKQNLMFKLLVPLVQKLQILSFGQKLLSKLFILYPRLSIYILNSGENL